MNCLGSEQWFPYESVLSRTDLLSPPVCPISQKNIFDKLDFIGN